MNIIAQLILDFAQNGLLIAACAYLAFAVVLAIGAWGALK
jgi:hypothetical protein